MGLGNKNASSGEFNQALDKTKGAVTKTASFAKGASSKITSAIKNNKSGKSSKEIFSMFSNNKGFGTKNKTSSKFFIVNGEKGVVAYFVIALVFAIFVTVAFVGITSVVGMGNWFSSKDDITKIRNNTINVIQEAYDEKRNTIYPYIAEYLNYHYGSSILADEISNDIASKETNSKITNVKIEFAPDAMLAVDKINAYASAVNSTLSLLGGDDFEAEGESTTQELTSEDAEEFVKMSDDERVDWLNNVKDDIDNNGNEYQTQLNESYPESLRKRKNQIFFVETDDSKWKIDINYKKNQIVGYHTKEVCTKYSSNARCLESYLDECCLSFKEYEDKNDPIIKDIIEGTITVPMNYNVSFYKNEEVDSLIEKMSEEQDISIQEANEIVYQYIYNYYNSYFAIYDVENDGDASVMGLDPIFLEDGIDGWNGHFTISDYKNVKYDYETKIKAGLSSGAIWSHVQAENGFSKDYTECVGLSLGFIYDAYGTPNVSGNGQNIVGSLVNEQGYLLLDTPAPGAIFSSGPTGMAGCDPNVSGCNPYGHTGVILEVTDSSVTYLEANYDRNGSIRIRTVSKTQMYSVFGSPYVKYAIPEYMKP